MKANKDIKVGQKLYVKRREMFGRRENDDLEEYEVTKVNTASVYAQAIGSDYEIRFDKRKLTHDNGMGTFYKAYLDANTYWDEVETRAELDKLRKEIAGLIPGLTVDKLKEIRELIKEK